jgi:hypothetical protein
MADVLVAFLRIIVNVANNVAVSVSGKRFADSKPC